MATPTPVPLAATATPCIDEHTRLAFALGNETTCICYTEFYGNTCEQMHGFYAPFNYALHSIALVIMSYLILWGILKMIDLGKKRMLNFRLSNIALYLCLIGCALRFVYLIISLIQPEALFSGNRSTPVLSPVASVIVVVAVMSWMAATSLILGFWVDVLQAKMRPTMAKRTKIVCMVGIVILVLAIPGLIFTLVFNNTTIGYTLILAPLVIDIVGMIAVYIILVVLQDKEEFTEDNRLKKSFATRTIMISIILWLLYFTAVILFGFSVNERYKYEGGLLAIPAVLLDTISEFGVACCVMFLVDRKGGVIKLIRHLCGWSNSASGTKTQATGTTKETRVQPTEGISSRSPDTVKMADTVTQSRVVADSTVTVVAHTTIAESPTTDPDKVELSESAKPTKKSSSRSSSSSSSSSSNNSNGSNSNSR